MGLIAAILVIIECIQINNCIYNYNITAKLDEYNHLMDEIILYKKIMKKVFLSGILIYLILFSIGVINTCTFMDMSDRKSLLLGVIFESILYFIFLIIIGKKDNYKIPKNKNNIKRELLFQFILFTICLILNIITFIYYKV